METVQKQKPEENLILKNFNRRDKTRILAFWPEGVAQLPLTKLQKMATGSSAKVPGIIVQGC